MTASWHGLLTWGIAILLTIYLLTSAIGGIIGGGFSALGSAASAAGSGLSNAAKPLAQAAGVTPNLVEEQAQAYLHPASPATMTPQDAQKEIASNLVTFAGGGADAPAAKERIINIMAAQMKISHDDAVKRFNDAQRSYSRLRTRLCRPRRMRPTPAPVQPRRLRLPLSACCCWVGLLPLPVVHAPFSVVCEREQQVWHDQTDPPCPTCCLRPSKDARRQSAEAHTDGLALPRRGVAPR